MPIRRGLSAPQNNFIETIIKRFDGPGRNFVLANAVLEELPIIYCNDGICKLYGYSRATLMQTSSDCKFFKGERTSPEALETIYRFLHEPNEQQIDVVLYKYDGKPQI
ncbi:uncharacterized protein TRIADDRAFT_22120 [Trichoplax adhaerens]|uniref:PAS domain-containing protein n=1 Tax=Trichoplax adhaerens TaxID=10228 RepID=B3RQL0_TRIAD|nr:hypothetical protein TRIADDRAFT_22120 [Trichoplax adhaerens]EDV27267.1 hypothetical protein TRIADDRAFT_22120 [Trichoplax adhaerens]|eukprot:XP_002111263.1 hypothetical protein TRIADDRAFT_22120 [Trichoplax adhaerens]